VYEVQRNGKTILEADACGIGFLASRKGVPERALVEQAYDLIAQFDHRGAPGHGAGIQVDIPWALLHERFPNHARLIAQRDVALGMFFLPYEATVRRECVERVEALAEVAGAQVLEWQDVPVCAQALPARSDALRTLPIVRQALFRRPAGLSEAGWFTCRYLLRLALDSHLGALASDQFSVASLSNRTVVYKGLCELSKLTQLYPDLDSPDLISRYVLFHSRYCTNTTTAWRRAQPFWAIAHNGEISTIAGNRAWMSAIGPELLAMLSDRFPSLRDIAASVGDIICAAGSDTANLDDMMIALMAGGLSMPQSLLSLLPGAQSELPPGHPVAEFYRSAAVYFGACDGPAAIVACDGDIAYAHLDRNGLRPLWIAASDDYVLAASELTGTLDLGDLHLQKLMGPGETFGVRLADGELMANEAILDEVGRKTFAGPGARVRDAQEAKVEPLPTGEDLTKLQIANGMGREDIDVLLKPMAEDGKPAIGSMGDDTPPAALLDRLPRRLEDHFALRFAQETSPPIDPIRDAWVFDTVVSLGDRRGPWRQGSGPLYRFESPVLSLGQLAWLQAQPAVATLSLLFEGDVEAHERALADLVHSAVETEANVLLLTDRGQTPTKKSIQPLRALSLIHRALVAVGIRNRISLAVDAAVWDIHHLALLTTLGADAVCPWLGLATVSEGYENGVERQTKALKALRSGLTEAMSMMGVTPSTAYCGAALAESVGLDPAWVAQEFGVPHHLGGISRETVAGEWLAFHAQAFNPEEPASLVDAGEFRHAKGGRPHANNAEIVRSLHAASGYTSKIHGAEPGTRAAFDIYSKLVSEREPITVLDLLRIKPGEPVPIDEVEPVENIAWRFMAPGMSEGALSEPAHRAVAQGLNVLARYCRIKAAQSGKPLPGGIGPIANSGEGGFDKARVGRRDFNRSVQYAGGRFTITPETAACAEEAEVKFAQGAKPGKGGQLPGKKVSALVARRRGCEPGFELVSPPINHNLYSIEDVKLMLESWRHLNPKVNCALKYVATYGVEMVAVGGVNAGANRLHLSDGCGGTGAAKRVDQKHAGVPVAAVLPTVHDLLLEDHVRHLVELSVDGGVQNGEQALKLFLLGADRVGFGTSLLISIGCSMLRKCHLSGPDPSDPTGKRRLGCTPGIATQDPQWIARFAGNWKHVAKTLLFAAEEVRDRMAAAGIRKLEPAIGRRDLLERRQDVEGKALQLDLSSLVRAPHASVPPRQYAAQTKDHAPSYRTAEVEAARHALQGEDAILRERLTNADRCVGVGAAGAIARARGDRGLESPTLNFLHAGAAGHFYAAYAVPGMRFRLSGVAADSCFTAAHGGELVVVPDHQAQDLALIGNAFAYGARGGEAFIAGRAGNRFAICLRKNQDGGSPTLVVEGVEANAFQYMTGGTSLVLGPTGSNLGSGMSGGVVYLLDANLGRLNRSYVSAGDLSEADATTVKRLLERHREVTGSRIASELLAEFDPTRFSAVRTRLIPEDPT
jgi:glutamate synthase domain-containing protein 2/glutamate synthase domain-containing protein 1/glutamate synthase domain-containing protein 3